MNTSRSRIRSYTFVHEGIINSAVPLLIGMIFGLQYWEIIMLIFGCFFVDIDHILHSLYKGKIRFGEMKAYFDQEFHLHRPHVYIFHIIEILVLFLIISHKYFPQFFLFFVGFAINILIDIAVYLITYRSFSPWLRFFSGTYTILYQYQNKNQHYDN